MNQIYKSSNKKVTFIQKLKKCHFRKKCNFGNFLFCSTRVPMHSKGHILISKDLKLGEISTKKALFFHFSKNFKEWGAIGFLS